MIFTYLCVVTFLGNDMNRVASKGASIIKEWTYKYIDSVSSCILCLFFFLFFKKNLFPAPDNTFISDNNFQKVFQVIEW